MRIKERIYPYPVIKEQGADFQNYKKSYFEYQIELRDNKLLVNIDTGKMIDALKPNSSNKISYGLQVESIKNKNRIFLSQKNPSFEVELSAKDFVDKVEINAFIYAEEEFSIDSRLEGIDVTSFLEGVLHFPKGGIIAVSRPTRQLNVLTNGNSRENPIVVAKDESLDDKDEAGLRFDIDMTHIKICLNSKNHKIYTTYGKSSEMKYFILNAMVLPAVTKALRVMIENKDDYLGEESNSPWAMLFNEKLENRGISLEEVSEGKFDFETVAQFILKNPIDKMFKDLEKISENR